MKTIILAGGIGSRLYPISTPEHPKQFLPLFEGETKSTFQLTVERALELCAGEDIYVVANRAHLNHVESQLGSTRARVIYEDVGRNTLPAVATAVEAIIEDDFPDDVVVVMPADHYIGTGSAPSIISAMEQCGKNFVVLGVEPTHPCTEYGYIQTAGPCAFVEKPSVELAEQYIQSGFLWNTGILVFSIPTFNAAVNRAAYRIVPISIDHGVLEKVDNISYAVLSASWTDCGSMRSLRDVLTATP